MIISSSKDYLSQEDIQQIINAQQEFLEMKEEEVPIKKPASSVSFESSGITVNMSNGPIKPLYFLPTNNGNTVGSMNTPYSHDIGAVSMEMNTYLVSNGYDQNSIHNAIANLIMERFAAAVDNNINIIINDNFGKIIDQYDLGSARIHLTEELSSVPQATSMNFLSSIPNDFFMYC